MCVCVCVCVCERECMYVCVCERESMCVRESIMCKRERENAIIVLHTLCYPFCIVLSYSYYIHTFVLHTLYVIFCIPSCMHTPVISCVLVRISISPLTVCMYVR